LKKRINQQKNSADTFAEWDSWDTINAVKSALELFNNVSLVEADLSSFEKLKNLGPDIVFNIAEGFFGESREAQIPAMLDMLQIPYTGSDPLTLATCLDKARTKEILSYYDIPTAPFFIASEIDQIKNLKLTFPLFVKPVWEGSSKGIFTSSFVNNTKELYEQVERIIAEYSQPALIEEFLSGREFTVAILGNGDEAQVLPIVEIDYKDFPDGFIPIYSYEAKWILDTKENPLDVFSCPAKLNPALETKVRQVALNAYKTLRCRDWSRIDIRMNADNVPNIIEINPLPGILPDPKENSCFPKAARTAGISYDEMLNRVLLAAARRYNLL
jgi:D-alanine-D-alanine ligase